MSQPAQSNVDVTIGASGFNPYRRSQFTDLSMWKKAGMSETAAGSYLGAIKASLESPNMVIDLRIPQNQRYEQVVLDTAVARFLAGELDADATMKAIESGWNEITDDLGKDDQLRAYKASIGAK
jgi:multiple sugar transport system substrate-binding protein